MIAAEFDKWNEDLCATFPAVRSWQRNMGDHSAGELLEKWCAALDDCDFADSLTVTARMLSGEDQLPESHSFHTIPAIVRRLARDVRWRRLALENRSQEPSGRDQTYRCKYCQDTGRIFVAHPCAVAAVLKGRSLARYPYRTSSTRCSFCPKGDARGPLESEVRGGDRPKYVETMAAFDPDLHYRLPYEQGAELAGELLDKFPDWVFDTKRDWDSRKRVSAFDEYNRQSEFA